MIFLRPTILNPDDEQSEENIRKIDRRLAPKYAPQFRSPSGKLLGLPDLDGEEMTLESVKDTPSTRPNL